ncbi:ETX/MTX2 family pore-forming toxin [Spiroplasma endosymbiont of Agriotes lineatus]|uniref:ETX/MTX2 family pore-forming toxin n=1 Tax=Spiroplasma endosymbiont of Agriotes lineatus TaxID=3077930 RepID=UPI0030CFD9F5
MKKLLGILRTITIAGGGMSGIVGNASASEKNEINYLQTSNLENLNRNKRDNDYEYGSFASGNRKIKFYGYDDWYKGEIKLNPYSSKIEFTGNSSYFHRYFASGNNTKYLQITIFDNSNYKIKDIEIGTRDWMQKVIEDNNLKNGINYENGYKIVVYTKEPWRTWFNIDNINNWTRYAHVDSCCWDYTKTFFIKNNNLVTYDSFGDLNHIITNTNLGWLNNNNKHTILDAVKKVNPNLDINKVGISNITATYANINGYNSNKYRNYKKVSFTVKPDLKNIIRNKSLHNLNNNSDIAILNELNYLNPNLDISQLEVKEKSNIFATIRAKIDSDKYFGEKKIYYSINNQMNRIINLDELIKKGIFLGFRDKNQGITIKEIKNINTSNLIYSNVTATKNIEPTYTKNSKSICFGTTTLFHNLPTKKNMKTPSCKYTKETTVNSQITTGLSKTKSEETRIEKTSTSSMEHNWNIKLNASGGIWPFSNVSETIGAGGSYGSSETNTSSEAKTLSNTFDFSNSKTNEYKEASEVELPSQEIEVNPNQKIKVTASLDEVLTQVTLKLTQNIYGEITSQITSKSNEEKSFKISIKEIMQKLKQYNLLPQEITINNNDSITFNGNANRALKQGFDSNIEFHEVK